MKKILFAIGGLSGGGAERVVSVWAGQLAEKGYEVGILVFKRSEGEYEVSPKVTKLAVAESLGAYQKMSYLERFRVKRRIVKDFSPDVVINFLPRVQIWMAAAMAGLKIKRIDTVRNSPWNFCDGEISKQLWKLCFETGDLTILQSEDQKHFFSKKVQKKCVIVPNPLNEAYETAGKSEFPEKAKRFVAAGRLSDQKNFPLLIRAFALASKTHPDITLDIYGKGTDAYTKKLNDLIEEVGMKEKIRLPGRSDNMHAVLMDHDAFIMSSDYEGMPNALAEAMAVGLVCVSTDCKTGPRDLIRDGENGYLTPVRDVEKMAEKIEKVADMDAVTIQKFGEKARSFVTDLCGRENSLNKLIQAIEK